MLLLDEPFGALDAKVRKELRRWLRRLHDELHVASVFVTHDQEEALEVADRVVLMNSGRIEQVGTPREVWESPATPFVYGFLGDVNSLAGVATRGVWQGAGLSLPAPELAQADGERATAYVRPHEFDIERYRPEGEGIAVRLSHAYLAGPSAYLELARQDSDAIIEAEVPEQLYRELNLRDGETLLARPRRADLRGASMTTIELPPVLEAGAAARWRELIETLADARRRYPDAALASSLAAEDMVLTHAISTPGWTWRCSRWTPAGCTPKRWACWTRSASATAARSRSTGQTRLPSTRTWPRMAPMPSTKASSCARLAARSARSSRSSALAGRGAWITGQRRAQSATRGELAREEQDATFGLYKFNPLADWSEAEVWTVIRALGIPYNPLHDQGYPSIGCEPCTRALRPGEDLRAGRWWWESSDSQECGLHAGNRVIAIAPVGDAGRP